MTQTPYRLVEFFGLPGSGKTTIARLLVKELEGRGIRCFPSWELVGSDETNWFWRQILRARFVAAALFFLPRASRIALKIAAGVKQNGIFDRLKLTWNLLVVLGLYALGMRQKSRLFVSDQGLFQAFWSFSFALRDHAVIDVWSDLARSLDMSKLALFRVEALADTARSRLRGRLVTSRAQRQERIDDARLWQRLQILDREVLRMAQNLSRQGHLGFLWEMNSTDDSSAYRCALAGTEELIKRKVLAS